ncbi:hypothetical protein EMIHUDRAFT_251233 [Emiliania huxleyi CCMP1516]|uniref:Peptidase S54 rhomboid domain-containing protein n=2 Tax=Emiliania huxleyi TaxID=2903 RepID=A0A0D3KWW8_EMIH1|nr:hypothetical protein EMIHUDRAFT_251233 [Emiliania huxleyi CCMP1516]EOD40253.1 hypothetical protein EMIHUDRAFT_251233 [Emiliania huxleyi CCMP1516]|eukprot:XP_005792682.1 hypothetical protein EMIHUDRAFT_251233 [Emiliania huxleyi CCMP1516]
MSASGGIGGGDSSSDPERWASLSGSDLSRELARRSTLSSRVRTSAPVRFSLAAAADGRQFLVSFARFWTGLGAAVPVNRLMLALIVAAYGLQGVCGRAMLYAGARMNQAILVGQWHRLITPIWLHGSLMHLASNSYSLWHLGPQAEALFGAERFLLLYNLRVGGNLLGLWMGAARSMSVGASGAVFGLMGGLAGHALRTYGVAGASQTLSSVSRILLLNLFIGSRRGSGIDNLGHVGGFLAGGALGVLLARGSPGDRSASRGPVWRDEPRDEPRADSTSAALGAVAVRAATVAVWAALALSTRDFAAMTANLRARGLR